MSRPTGEIANFCLFPTSLGECGIAWRGDTVIATQLPDIDPARTQASLAKQTGGQKADPPETIRRAIRAITALLDGQKPDLDFIACDMQAVEPFSRAVYDATRAIPVGQTRTYGEIAEALGGKQLSQRVGQALGRNPFPIVVPCHRVMGANGTLTGFSATGGISTKLKMLEIEGAQLGQEGGLFDDLPLAVKPH